MDTSDWALVVMGVLVGLGVVINGVGDTAVQAIDVAARVRDAWRKFREGDPEKEEEGTSAPSDAKGSDPTPEQEHEKESSPTPLPPVSPVPAVEQAPEQPEQQRRLP
ncbi:hypothetical protein ACPYPG_08270 [Streptomyces sp. FR-108]|uniref:hypothetical protein n=1 Tax=Streptomyces sp. FR-108 TaxID=3416665 RepID=UPI003CF37C75